MKKTFLKLFKNYKNKNAGVTFIELIVVISIFALISTVVLFNFGDFSTSISLQNVSQDIALKIAEAQRSAVSGRSNVILANTPTTPEYSPTYGVLFSTALAQSSITNNFYSPGKEFVSFIDLPDYSNPAYGNGIYDIGSTPGQFQTTCLDTSQGNFNTECLDRSIITTGDRIIDICIDGDQNCGYNDVTILFRRPFPDAIIHTSDDSYSASYGSAEIKITSAKGAIKSVFINKLGQVSVR